MDFNIEFAKLYEAMINGDFEMLTKQIKICKDLSTTIQEYSSGLLLPIRTRLGQTGSLKCVELLYAHFSSTPLRFVKYVGDTSTLHLGDMDYRYVGACPNNEIKAYHIRRYILTGLGIETASLSNGLLSYVTQSLLEYIMENDSMVFQFYKDNMDYCCKWGGPFEEYYLAAEKAVEKRRAERQYVLDMIELTNLRQYKIDTINQIDDLNYIINDLKKVVFELETENKKFIDFSKEDKNINEIDVSPTEIAGANIYLTIMDKVYDDNKQASLPHRQLRSHTSQKSVLYKIS